MQAKQSAWLRNKCNKCQDANYLKDVYQNRIYDFGEYGGAALAEDGKPFLDNSELRVYQKDWLVVCETNGQNVCRMVSTKLHSEGNENSKLYIYPASQSPRQSDIVEYNNAVRRNHWTLSQQQFVMVRRLQRR